MRIDIHGFAKGKHVAQISVLVEQDDVQDILTNPKAYLFAQHPEAKFRGVDGALAEVYCKPDLKVA